MTVVCAKHVVDIITENIAHFVSKVLLNRNIATGLLRYCPSLVSNSNHCFSTIADSIGCQMPNVGCKLSVEVTLLYDLQFIILINPMVVLSLYISTV